MQFEALGLIVRPVIVGFGPEENARGMGAMRRNSHHRQPHGQKGGKDTDLLSAWIGLVLRLRVDFQFSHLKMLIRGNRTLSQQRALFQVAHFAGEARGVRIVRHHHDGLAVLLVQTR